MTDEEASRLRGLYAQLDEPAGLLDLRPDPEYAGWQTMHGPCSFMRDDVPLARGGCRIYEDRPGTCRVFACKFLRERLKTED